MKIRNAFPLAERILMQRVIASASTWSFGMSAMSMVRLRSPLSQPSA